MPCNLSVLHALCLVTNHERSHKSYGNKGSYVAIADTGCNRVHTHEQRCAVRLEVLPDQRTVAEVPSHKSGLRPNNCLLTG